MAEVIRVVGIALERGRADTCPAIPGCLPGEDCAVGIDSLVSCVASALASCSPARDPTATPTATPDDAAPPALALADDVAERVCSGVLVTPGGSFATRAVESGAELSCASFTGHEGTVRLTGYASSADALAAFGQPGSAEEVLEIGGGTARILPTVPSCCPEGSLIDWAWVRDCWLVTGRSFDDTHFQLAPDPKQVVEEILGSPLLESFLSHCSDRSCAASPGPRPGRQTLYRLVNGSTITHPNGPEEQLSGWLLLSNCFSPNTFVAGRVETLRFTSNSAVIESACPASGTLIGSTLYGGDRPVSYFGTVTLLGEEASISGDGPYLPGRLDLSLQTGNLSIRILAEPEARDQGFEPMCSEWGFI